MREVEASASSTPRLWIGLGGLAAMALASVIAFTAAPVTIAPPDDRAPVATERSWKAIIEAGDAFVRVSVAAGTPDGGKPNARRAYMAALMHAQRQQSVDGVLGVGRAFRALGDMEAADYCVRIADTLAARQGRR